MKLLEAHVLLYGEPPQHRFQIGDKVEGWRDNGEELDFDIGRVVELGGLVVVAETDAPPRLDTLLKVEWVRAQRVATVVESTLSRSGEGVEPPPVVELGDR